MSVSDGMHPRIAHVRALRGGLYWSLSLLRHLDKDTELAVQRKELLANVQES